MSVASPVGTKPYLHSRGWIRPASCPSPPSTAGTSSDLSEYTSCISHPEAILQLQAFAESLTYRLVCQRINILKATLNQGWWELADPSPSFLATLLLAVGQLWAKSQQSLEGPQQDGNSVDPRGSIIILLIWHPAIISLGIRTKTRKMQLQTALLFEYHDHFVLTILLGRRKEIDTSSRKYKQFQEQNFNSFPFITRVQRENVIYVISLDICLLVLDGTEKPKQAFWPTQYFSAELALRKLESGHHFLFTCNLCFAFQIPEIEVNIFPMPCISF